MEANSTPLTAGTTALCPAKDDPAGQEGVVATAFQ